MSLGGPVPSLPLPVAPGRVVRNVLRPSRAPRVACPLLTVWDDPSCTEGVVSVSKGERAVMTCNTSSPFLGVAIQLIAPGRDSRPLFRVKPPGCFCRDGWQLQVQGSVAQLVIPEASGAQAGRYRWHLQSRQRNIRDTTLNVLASEPEAQDLNQAGNMSFSSSCGPQTLCLPQAEGQVPVVVVVIGVIVLLILAVTGVACCRRHRPLYSKPPSV